MNEICSASPFSGSITEEVIQHKKKAIRKLNQLLEDYISNGNQDSLKKVDLLSYWIEEYGGLHYAIVLNNNNARNSPVVTVVPLTSFIEGDKLHDDVFPGNEIYKFLKLNMIQFLKC